MSVPFKLGCKPAVLKPNHPNIRVMKTLMGRKAIPVLDRSRFNPHPKMLMNDQIGDCTCAGLLNGMNCIESVASNGQAIVPYVDSDALTLYEKAAGYNPNDPNTDTGMVETELLEYTVRNGVGVGPYRYYPVWGTCDISDRNAIALIMQYFGFAYLGVVLRTSDQDMSKPWDTLSSDSFDVWGAHCLLVYDYTGLGDTDLVSCITWGGIYRGTWRWLMSRLMECHAVAFRQLHHPSSSKFTTDDWEAFVAANSDFLKNEIPA